MSSYLLSNSISEWDDSDLPEPFVYREGSRVSLHFQISAIQSMMDADRPTSLVCSYTRLMMAVLLFVPEPKHLACIGLGGGSIPKYCHRYLEQTRVSVAEINPKVIALRDQFFIPADSHRFRVFQIDGAEFVIRNPTTFDVLMVDAFDHTGQPSNLCSVDFYQSCFDALTPNGYLVVNLCHEGTRKAVSWLERVFQKAVRGLRDCDSGNLIAIVGREDAEIFPQPLPERARLLEELHPLFFREMASLLDRPPRRMLRLGRRATPLKHRKEVCGNVSFT